MKKIKKTEPRKRPAGRRGPGAGKSLVIRWVCIVRTISMFAKFFQFILAFSLSFLSHLKVRLPKPKSSLISYDLLRIVTIGYETHTLFCFLGRLGCVCIHGGVRPSWLAPYQHRLSTYPREDLCRGAAMDVCLGYLPWTMARPNFVCGKYYLRADLASKSVAHDIPSMQVRGPHPIVYRGGSETQNYGDLYNDIASAYTQVSYP